MTTIQIEIAREDGARCELESLGAKLITEPDHFEGGTEIISAVVMLTPVVVPAVVSLVKSRIAANRYVKVKLKGIEITGASLNDIEKFLNNQKSTN